jgi:hypothetical protein
MKPEEFLYYLQEAVTSLYTLIQLGISIAVQLNISAEPFNCLRWRLDYVFFPRSRLYQDYSPRRLMRDFC